jgi:hypothetical protein
MGNELGSLQSETLDVPFRWTQQWRRLPVTCLALAIPETGRLRQCGLALAEDDVPVVHSAQRSAHVQVG